MPRTTAALVLAVCLARGVSAIQAFDCKSKDTAFMALDLREPAKCADPQTDFEGPFNRTVQILQTSTAITVKAYRCQATVSKQVTRCGFNGITYGSTWPMWEKEIEITPGECREALDKGRLKVLDRVYKVEQGTKTTKTYYSRGMVHTDGSCETEDFVSWKVWYAK